MTRWRWPATSGTLPAGPGRPSSWPDGWRSCHPPGPAHLAPGFELSAAVLRHLQADPLLPAALLPADWPGRAFRRTYDRWDRRYRTVLTTWGRRGLTATAGLGARRRAADL